jgi:hypothetical protein
MPDGASFRVLPNEAPARVFAGFTPWAVRFLAPTLARTREGGARPGIRYGFKFGRALKAGGSVAIADFNTSLVKKNFPSFGTIMICT